jgi:dolichol-phosphate mannosyltransferase
MELTVIVPTRNESDTIEEVVERVQETMRPRDLDYEILVVDDSDDDTPDKVARAGIGGAPVRLCHRRPDDRGDGLAGAVRHGLALSAGSKTFAVMDGDLQHPPELLGELVDAVRRDADVAVASRYIAEGGDVAGLDGRGRRFTSRAARAAARLLLRRARSVEDPLSGFFAVRRHVVEGAPLEARGFKILLEVLVVGRWRSAVEVPLRMEPRAGGRSKAGVREGLVFGAQLSRLLRVSLSPRLRSSASSSAYVRS